MSVSQEQLARIVAQARNRESQGYFEKVRQGDQRAASLFARLIAFDLNPSGSGADVGWLTKTPGESNVEGFAEDAICGNAHPDDLANVIDLVNGAGAKGASIGGSVKERRRHNQWFRPQALTAEEMLFLREGIPAPVPQPPAHPQQPYPSEPGYWNNFTKEVKKRYPNGELNDEAFRWFTRTAYDIGAGMDRDESAAKHLKELDEQIGR